MPPESIESLRVLDALAGLLRDSAEYSEAEPLLVRGLRLREAAFGPASAELISTLDSLAYVYFGQEKYAEAQPVYERLLALWETSGGPEHPMVALTLDKMAEFYAAQKRYANAEPLMSRATALRTKFLLESLKQAGRIQSAHLKMEEAAELYRRAILIADESGIFGESLVPILRAYAKTLRDLGRDAEAEAVDKRIE